jgi:hypothetical protein
VFQSPHDDAVQRVLWQLEARVLLQALNVDQGTHELGVQQGLVGQPLDVFGCVGVDMLQRAGELVVEPLDERHHAAGDAEDLAFANRRKLVVVLPLLGILDDDNLVVVLEDLKELAVFLVRTGMC